MSEKPKNQKQPIWEPFDEKQVEEGRRFYIEAIGAEKAHLNEYTYKQNNPVATHQTPSMKAHFATLALMEYHHIDMLEKVYGVLEIFVEMSKQLAVTLQSLDSQIQEISEKTGVDLSRIKSEMAQVRETVNAPIYKYLKEQKEGEEKIRKSGEETFDHLTRSH
jgi:hypothetical protein